MTLEVTDCSYLCFPPMFFMLNGLLLLNKCDGLSWGKGPVGIMGHGKKILLESMLESYG